MRNRHNFLVLNMLVVLAVVCGCHEAFLPYTEYNQELVVYGIMNTSRDRQIVRVHATYPNRVAGSTGGQDNPVKGARVTISDGVQTFSLRDTLLPHADTGANFSDIPAYVSTGLTVLPGRTYRLEVSTPDLGTVSGTCRLPRTGFIHLNRGYTTLFKPHDDQDHITLVPKLSDLSKGFLLQFMIEYDIVNGAVQKRVQSEIPVDVRGKTSDTSFTAIYPQLLRAPTFETEVAFHHDAYLTMLLKIKAQHQGSVLIGRYLKFYLYQLEPSLYDYYKLVNAFQDPYSIRTDKPDRTNIQGGYGVFGGMTVDSVIYSLPPGFFSNI